MTGTGKKSWKKIWIIVIITLIILLAALCGADAFFRDHIGKHSLTRCIANLKLNAHICLLYGEENEGILPDSSDYIKQNSGYMQCLKDPEEMADSYFLIPGLTTGNSPEMPLMIEKIGNHKEQKILPVVFVGGNAVGVKKELRRYSELLPEFSGITPEEKEYLRQIFLEWDKGNFSFRPESPFRKRFAK